MRGDTGNPGLVSASEALTTSDRMSALNPWNGSAVWLAVPARFSQHFQLVTARVMKVETDVALEFVGFPHAVALRGRPVRNAQILNPLHSHRKRIRRNMEFKVLAANVRRLRLE